MIRPRFFSRHLLLGFVITTSVLMIPADWSWADDAKKQADQVETAEIVPLPTIGEIDPVSKSEEPYVKPSETELRKRLSNLQFRVTQEESTEPARSNGYWNNKKKGTYECIVCGQDLFTSETKYRSGTGWPSFYAPIDEKQVGFKTDYHLVYPRTEVHCSRCNAHLGHVFDDGPQPTGKRYCMNSASLNFIETESKSSAKKP